MLRVREESWGDNVGLFSLADAAVFLNAFELLAFKTFGTAEN